MRLTRAVGRAHALDLILRAKKIDGPTALAIGLVHEVHPIDELKARAIGLAEELAAKPPIAVAGVLRCVVGAEHLSLEDALRNERDAAVGATPRPTRPRACARSWRNVLSTSKGAERDRAPTNQAGCRGARHARGGSSRLAPGNSGT